MVQLADTKSMLLRGFLIETWRHDANVGYSAFSRRTDLH
jgi:hypothetical protein